MKYFLIALTLFVSHLSFAQNNEKYDEEKFDTLKPILAPKLNLPFGTICKLQVEILDGESLQMKEYANEYLVKEKTINDSIVKDKIIFSFKDETKQLPNNNFDLSEKEIKKLKAKYVGKTYTVMAYESGAFEGIPKHYFKYKPIVAAKPFHFKNYLVVLTIEQ